MAGDWVTLPLGDLTVNFDGRRVPVREADRKPGPYPYYGASGIVDHVDGYLFDGDYLLIAEDGENLRTRQTPVAFMATGKFWVNNHAHIVQGNERSTTRFLHYALAATDISGYLTGSTMPKLTQGNLNRIPVVAPPLPEQKRIAHILGSLDDKIELNRRMNATLEGISRAIFKSWFVDFDPVRQKAAGKQPVGMDSQTAALFPDSFEESEIGEVPKGWAVTEVRDFLSLKRESVDPAEHPAETFDHYSIPAFDAGCWPSPDVGHAIKSQKLLVPPGCVLISKLNPRTPRVWVPQATSDRRRIASTEFLVAVPAETKGVGLAYLFCFALSESVVDYLACHASGTSNSHQRVRPDDVLSYQVALPPADVLLAFDRVAGPPLRKACHARAQSWSLAALRDTLLPKLLSGEIRVPKAEQAIEEATT
jgi:type I restriction enzyme S subunit